MSYIRKFTRSAIDIIYSTNATNAFNVVIALPRAAEDIDPLKWVEHTGHLMIVTKDLVPSVASGDAVADELDESSLPLAHAIIEGKIGRGVVIIDDTSYQMPDCLRRAIERQMREGRKGFVILRKPLKASGFEGLAEIVMIDQTVYG